MIRKPAVAGHFYPKSPQQLEEMIAGMVDKKAAREAGVKYIVRVSGLGADSNPEYELGSVHGSADKAVMESGLPYSILKANSFMQNPVGYKIAESGRAEMTDFFALIKNPNVWLQFPHVALGGLTTAAFFVLGISAFHLLRNKSENLEAFRESARISLLIGTVAVLATMGFGHAQGQRSGRDEPSR